MYEVVKNDLPLRFLDCVVFSRRLALLLYHMSQQQVALLIMGFGTNLIQPSAHDNSSWNALSTAGI